MKTISALFLFFLLAHVSLAQKDIVELLEKSAEGKEVLNNLLLQVSVNGKFNIGKVSTTLKSMDAMVRNAMEARNKAVASEKKSCTSDIAAVKGRFHDLTVRALTVNRALDATRLRQKRRGLFLSRAGEELEHYKSFRTMMNKNGKAWAKFYAAARKNSETVVDLLTNGIAKVKAVAKTIAKTQTKTNAVSDRKLKFNVSNSTKANSTKVKASNSTKVTAVFVEEKS